MKYSLEILINLEEMMWQKRIKSVTQLSKMTGITRQTLHRLKNNDCTGIQLETLSTLCKALDCDIEDLIISKK